MTQLNANVSPLIPHQFPGVYREQEPQLVEFVRAYYQWLEQSGNIGYYTRRIYDIKDIDETDDQFIIYFKEKYLKNIIFNIEADIRLVVKHALDIYRSKGTERCATLLFQLAFNTKPSFYYPSTDIMRLDDGQFVYPYYLELSLGWDNVVQLYQKEIVGVFSGARGFVDNIIRRRTNGRFEDIAYISGIFGKFQPGEKVLPLDGSLAMDQCPSIAGSLNSITLLPQGSGTGYMLNAIVPVSSTNGSGGLAKILSSANAIGVVQLNFIDGGWGYQVNAIQATLHYTGLAGSAFVNGSDVWTYYANNAVMGVGEILTVNTTVAVVDVMSGNLNNTVGKLFSYGNTSNATISTYVGNTYGPNVYISNATMTVSNMTMSTANLEEIHYFTWLETITQPLANIGYISCNSAAIIPFPVGANVYVYYANNAVAGTGCVLVTTPGSSNTGTIVASVLSGNLQTNQTFYTSGNTVKANTNTYANVSATALFIANSQAVTLNMDTANAGFIGNEIIFQQIPLTGPMLEEKIGGWGTVVQINSATSITCNVVQGRFIQGPVIGLSSQATANVVSVGVNFGVVNVVGQFFQAPLAHVYSNFCSGYLTTFGGGGGATFSVTIAPTLLYPENVSTAIDKISTYGALALNATAYGFPAKPAGNGSTGMANLMTYAQTTIGKLASISTAGSGSNFNQIPYIVIDNPYISEDSLKDDFLQFSGPTGPFAVGEVVTQAFTNAKGIVRPASNNLILTLQRLSYANDFVVTANAATQIVGVSSGSVANVVGVDHDIFSPTMGRNTMTDVLFTTGNNVVTEVGVVDSGFGFVNGEQVTIGSNGSVGTAVVGAAGTGSGFYLTKGGFLDDVKKLYDGWFYQNYSYQVIAPLMLSEYQQMLQDITHVAGTKMFGKYVHTGVGQSNVTIHNAVVNTHAVAII